MLVLSHKHSKLNRRGDTIVEVLISLAILGMAFGISFSTAHKSLLSTRNSQEHSEALQLLNSQLELIRANVNKQQQSSPVFNSTSTFCMNPADDQPLASTASTCTTFGVEGFYKVSIAYVPTTVNGVNQDVFTLTVNWTGVGQLGLQQEQLSYKIHPNDSL